MEQNKSLKDKNLKHFFIKLFSIVLSIIIILNVAYNLLLSERLEKVDKLLLMGKDDLEFKIRKELNNAIEKDELIPREDRELLIRFIDKIKSELEEVRK
tara:strand:+ start:392 stop:688 length:297 start_codon:yes stop_codon:yes gene_type:complete